ncbi:MAG TPA: hypothetical protein PKW28_05680, partial [Turneriella sp.]|nr:hypothetical protein [Turneriella sp.]
SLCVQVCPTGIDIRNGLQYECIGCGLCVDACDSVMDKVQYPRGLIRFATQNGMAQRWSSAQGLSVTPDNTAAGLNYHRAAIVSAPGLTFRLRRPVTEKGSEFANGWTLNLDIAAIRARDGQSNLARYQNLLECEVLVDDVLYKTIRQGSHASAVSLVKISIPHIRSTDGVITVRLRMANHPRNFLFLYDAFLSR